MADMFRATRYCIYPNAEQEVLLAKHFGCVRWLYNRALIAKKEAWAERKENLTRFAIQSTLSALKRAKETCWLKEVNSQSLQSSLVNLKMAYARFFREKKGFPKFKSKHHRQSFQVPQSGIVGDDSVQIPIVGKLKANISRPAEGKIKTITISKTPTGGKVNDALTLRDRVWTCACGVTHDRDLLAANNIKRVALHPRNSLRQEMPEFTPEEILV